MSLKEPVDLNWRRSVSRSQLAVGILPYGETDKSAPLEIVSLNDDDPWRRIYLCCLGTLPEHIDAELIRSGNWLPELEFSDFATVRRASTVGSLKDLLARTMPEERTMTPRQLSLIDISHAGTASTAIRASRQVLPQPWFARFDAGPNILVVCSEDSVEDLALLWNLRAAHGDFYSAPIGVPSDGFSPAVVRDLLSTAALARHGISATTLYVTSCSLTTEELADSIGDLPGISIRPPNEMLAFGTILGWSRDEVLVWRDGTTSFRPVDYAGHQETLRRRNLNPLLIMQYDLTVEDSPLPQSDDYRIDPHGGAFYNGARTIWASLERGESVASAQWPSRQTVSQSLASIRDFRLAESPPGVAARILIEMLGGLQHTYLLCHAPLLQLLESMASRQGFNWYKDRLRKVGVEADPREAVGSTIDELPERSFHDFKKVFGNSDPATKYWLAWAERSSVILKGFPLQCPHCAAKQWVPVGQFRSPVICRGCAKSIDYPFGDRPIIDFKYRLTEQTRRVYESDAMGHILAARFFASVFDFGSQSSLIGMHPGMSVYVADDATEVGEADLLILTRRGEFIPIEVKRTASGLTDGELKKLEVLSIALLSPWTGVVACQYRANIESAIEDLVTRNSDGTYRRIVLTYDHLLSPHAFWAMGGDPFLLEGLSEEEIASREKDFVTSLVRRSKEGETDWFTESMLRRRDPKAKG